MVLGLVITGKSSNLVILTNGCSGCGRDRSWCCCATDLIRRMLDAAFFMGKNSMFKDTLNSIGCASVFQTKKVRLN